MAKNKKALSKTSRTNRSEPRLGRKRDPARDTEILEAALDVLGEVGYDRMTTDMVAARAKAGKGAMYRRWSSKAELVIEAVSNMKRAEVDGENLPDTGSLREDLLALYKPQSIEAAQRKLKVMAGVVSMLSQDSQLAEAAQNAIFQPWLDVQSILIDRAMKRKEVTDKVEVKIASQIIPSLIIYRIIVQRRALDRKFLATIIDSVLLPALKK